MAIVLLSSPPALLASPRLAQGSTCCLCNPREIRYAVQITYYYAHSGEVKLSLAMWLYLFPILKFSYCILNL